MRPRRVSRRPYRSSVSMGYRPVDKPEGTIVFRPPERWMGRVTLDVHGDLTFGRPVVAYKSAQLHDTYFNATVAASGKPSVGQALGPEFEFTGGRIAAPRPSMAVPIATSHV